LRVLIVDDEPRYRAYLGSFLGANGHEVAVAGSGREAIDVGIRFQPELLLTDWMLRNHFHGLHVARTLRTIEPGLPTILMTGFPSAQLRAEAKQCRVFQYIEKPFEIEELRSVVLRASHAGEVRREAVPFGVLITDDEGFIVAASEKARSMFERCNAGTRPGRLSDLFDSATLEELAEPTEEWLHVAPTAPVRIRWWVRSRQERGRRIYVLLPERRKFLRLDPRIILLLDLPFPAVSPLPPGTRVLVVDDRTSLRPSYLATLEGMGCIAYPAREAGLALRLLRDEPGIDLVVIDHRSLDLESLLAELRVIRPDVEVVGVSDSPAEASHFANAGILKQLHRPWRVGDLVQLLAE
jgi:DNA-binding NtrC family response regulator